MIFVASNRRDFKCELQVRWGEGLNARGVAKYSGYLGNGAK